MQYAHIAGATVAAVDIVGSKLDVAKGLGATYLVNAATEDPAEAIQALGGADAAIVLAATPQACEQAFASLRRNGTLVLVGLPADNVMRLPIFETVLKGLGGRRTGVVQLSTPGASTLRPCERAASPSRRS